jgi:hypothetical protein
VQPTNGFNLITFSATSELLMLEGKENKERLIWKAQWASVGCLQCHIICLPKFMGYSFGLRLLDKET